MTRTLTCDGRVMVLVEVMNLKVDDVYLCKGTLVAFALLVLEVAEENALSQP